MSCSTPLAQLSPSLKMQDDPTNVKNVLTALKATRKGRLIYPEPVRLEEDEDEVCDLKYIGDLNHISFSPGYSFAEQLSETESEGDNQDDDEDEKSFSSVRRNILSDPTAEDTSGGNRSEQLAAGPTGKLASLAHHYETLNILLAQLQLNSENQNTMQLNILKRRDAYIKSLCEIRALSECKLKQFREEQESVREQEALRLRLLEQTATEEIKKKEEEYKQKVEERKNRILEEIEEANKRVAEQAAIRTALIQELQTSYSLFSSMFAQIQNDLKQLTQEVTLDDDTEEALTTTQKNAAAALETITTSTITDNELLRIHSDLEDGHHTLAAIQNAIAEAKKVAEVSAEKEEEEKAKHQTKEQVPEQQNSTRSPEYASNIDASSKEALQEAERRFCELEKFCKRVTEESEPMKDDKALRPLLSRSVGIVNQLNADSHSSNRGKLQQLANLLSGQPCTVGDSPLNINGKPAAVAFVKDQLAVKIISLAHDKQSSSMAIYTSLIIRLWQMFPEVGQLILYRLYETCPFLVPRIFSREPGQTDEQYHRSLGFRHKDGGVREAFDKYLTRMGTAAQLYGHVISMDASPSHPHGLHNGWKMLACITSLPPYPGVTAAVLNGFLSTAGHALLKTYGKQFAKLLNLIRQSYFPQIECETVEGGDAVTANLKKLLETYQQTGTIPPPERGYRCLL